MLGKNDPGGEVSYRPPRAAEVPHYRTEPIQTSVGRRPNRTRKKTRGKPWARPVSVYPRETPPRRRRADGAVLLLAVALTELVDAAADVQRLLLAGVERVRVARDIELDHRVFVTVFPLDRFLAGHGRTRNRTTGPGRRRTGTSGGCSLSCRDSKN